MPSKSAAQARLMAAEERLYIAGLFDGEGYVNVSESKRTSGRGVGRPIFMFCVGITNTYLPILEWLTQFGGTIHRKSRDQDYWAQAFEWRATGNTAQRFLAQIAPHLKIKKAVVDQALIYRWKWGHWTTSRYSDEQLVDRRADREKVVCLVNRRRKPSL